MASSYHKGEALSLTLSLWERGLSCLCYNRGAAEVILSP
jgi:hypothetical protein